MTTLAAWLIRLQARAPKTHALGLARIARVTAQLGVVPRAPLITVAGTNGKGSTCAYLEAIFANAGYQPLCCYSPHLLDFDERIRVAGAPVDAQLLVEQFALLQQADDATRSPDDIELTYFEYVTAAAVLCGNAKGCGVFVLEVGLGGRLDATNVFDADVAVITSVGIDHVEFLGPDREWIGAEKACIARSKRPLIIGDREPPHSVLAKAKEIGAIALVRGRDFHAEVAPTSWTYRGATVRRALPPPAMRGAHQLANAACACAALEQLDDRLPVNQAQARAGLHDAQLTGRFEVLAGEVPVVLDVAHNAPAAKVLADGLLDHGYFPNTQFVLGVRVNKDAAGIVAVLAKRAAGWHVAGVGTDSATARAKVLDALQNSEEQVAGYVSVAAAAAGAHAAAVAAPGGRVVVCGSFSTVEEYLRVAAHAQVA